MTQEGTNDIVNSLLGLPGSVEPESLPQPVTVKYGRFLLPAPFFALLADSFQVSHVSSSGGARSGPRDSSSGGSVASIWDTLWQGDEYEQDQGADFKEHVVQKDAVVFLIDCGPSMFTPMEGGDLPFVAALRCASVAVTQKLISSPDDEVAVVLYGTGEQRGDFPGVYVLSDFDKPTTQLVQQLEALQKPDAYKLGHWETNNPGVEFPMCDAFWTASSLLSRIKSASDRRVWLFTDEDTPHQDEDMLGRAVARLEDYRSSGVQMSLFAFQRAGTCPFNLAPFYRLCPDPDIEEGTENWTAMSRLDAMERKAKQKVMKKRSLGSLKFTLCPGVEFAVKLYTMLRSADQLKHIYLDPETQFPVKPRTKWVCGDTGQHLRPTQMKKYFPFGEYKVVFEQEEINRLKFLYPPGITLLGFKSLHLLSDIHNFTHASFIFCDDNAIKGSGLVFKLLLQKCIVNKKFALVRLVTRSNAIPRLAALYPGREVFENDEMVTPSGFHVIPLPWAEEIRQLEVKQDFAEATPTMEQCMAASKAKINFFPLFFFLFFSYTLLALGCRVSRQRFPARAAAESCAAKALCDASDIRVCQE